MVAFVANSFITLAIAITSLLYGILRDNGENAIDAWVSAKLRRVPFFYLKKERRELWTPIIESLVLALSDQQLLTGIAIIVTACMKHCSISAYHFTIAFDLAWFASSTHLNSLDVLQVRLAERPSSRNWRVCLMLAIAFALAVASILQGNQYWYAYYYSPAQCLFSDLRGNYSGDAARWSVANLLFLVFSYSAAILSLYEVGILDYLFYEIPVNKLKSVQHTVRFKRSVWASTGGFASVIARISLSPVDILLLGAVKSYVGIAALLGSTTCSLLFGVGWFTYLLWGLISDRDIPPSQLNGDENEWGFGQIVPVLLLSSIILTFRELYIGEGVLILTLCLSCSATNRKQCRAERNTQQAKIKRREPYQ